jgi:hypothetical protein
VTSTLHRRVNLFGDNRFPGRDLHDTPVKAACCCVLSSHASIPGQMGRAKVPPSLLGAVHSDVSLSAVI